MNTWEKANIARLKELTDSLPELPLIVRNVQESEAGFYENNMYPPYWLGCIDFVEVGRYAIVQDGACDQRVLFDLMTEDDDEESVIEMMIDTIEMMGWKTELGSKPTADHIRAVYESFPWKTAIIVSLGRYREAG